MSNFSQKSQVIIESFQKDRGELPVQQSEELVEFKSLMKDYIRYRIMNEQFGGPVQLTASPTKKKIDPNNVTELLASLEQGESVKSGPYKGLGRGALARLAQMEKGTEEEKEKAAEYGKERELHQSVEDVRKAGESRWFDVTKEGEVDPNVLAIATDVALSAIPVGGIASGAVRLALAKSPLGRTMVSKGLDLAGKFVGRTPTSKLGGAAKTARESKGLVAGVKEVEKDLLKAGVKGIQTGAKGAWEGTKWAANKLASKATQQAANTGTSSTSNLASKLTLRPAEAIPLVGKHLGKALYAPKGSGIVQSLKTPFIRTIGGTEAIGAAAEMAKTSDNPWVKAAGQKIADTNEYLFGGETLFKQAGKLFKGEPGVNLQTMADRVAGAGTAFMPFSLIAKGAEMASGVSIKDLVGQGIKTGLSTATGVSPEDIVRREGELIGGVRSVTGTEQQPQQQSQQQRPRSSRPSWEEFRDYFRGIDPNANEEEMRRSWERQFGGR